MMFRRRLLTLSLALCAVASTAEAKDLDGRFGVGGSLRPSLGGVPAPTTSVDVLYWSGQFGLAGRFAVSVLSPAGRDTSIVAGAGASFYYTFASFEDVNLSTGLDIDAWLSYAGTPSSNALHGLSFAIPLRGEAFLNDNFAINASVALGVDLSIDPEFVRFGTRSGGAVGSAGFTWYF